MIGVQGKRLFLRSKEVSHIDDYVLNVPQHWKFEQKKVN